jgi:hypothetical protein
MVADPLILDHSLYHPVIRGLNQLHLYSTIPQCAGLVQRIYSTWTFWVGAAAFILDYTWTFWVGVAPFILEYI